MNTTTTDGPVNVTVGNSGRKVHRAYLAHNGQASTVCGAERRGAGVTFTRRTDRAIDCLACAPTTAAPAAAPAAKAPTLEASAVVKRLRKAGVDAPYARNLDRTYPLVDGEVVNRVGLVRVEHAGAGATEVLRAAGYVVQPTAGRDGELYGFLDVTLPAAAPAGDVVDLDDPRVTTDPAERAVLLAAAAVLDALVTDDVVEAELEARRQAEAPAPTLPGIDSAIVEAELGGLAEAGYGEARDVVVVPCSGAKLDRPAPAGELYTGSLYRSARLAADALAERTGAHVVILSALHGLTELDKVLEPYDVTVGDELAVTVEEVAAELAMLRATRVVALTPGRYTALLAEACTLAGVDLVTPLAGTRGVLDQRGRLRRIRVGELAVA